MRVTVTDDMVAIAEAIERKVKANFKRDRNYTGLKADRRYYFGALGELAFYKAITSRFIKMRYEPATDGKADKCDFNVWVKGSMVDLDIKTASQATHSYLMVPAAQIAKHPVTVYVAARVDGNEVEFLGYAYLRDLEATDITDKLGLKTKTCGIPFDQLRPIEHIFEQTEVIG